MTPLGTRPACGAILALVFAAGCQATTTPTAPPSNTAATAAPAPASSPSPAPSASPEPAPSSTAAPSAPASAAREASTFEAAGEARDVLFAPDGRIVVVTRDFTTGRSQVAELDASGALLPGWPWSGGDAGGSFATAALGPDATVWVAVRSERTDPDAFSWSLHRLDTAGVEVTGFPVDLPAVEVCSLWAGGDGTAYAACEHDDDTTLTPTTTITTVRPDGSTPAGWPVKVDASVTSAGFLPDGSAVLWEGVAGGSRITALRPDATVAGGWPVAVPDGGSAVVDAAGRVRVTSRTYQEDQCGSATGTTYSVLAADGSTVPGWPVHLKGWASDPLVGDDGSMTILTGAGRAVRYGIDGTVAGAWHSPKIAVAVGCYAGSSPVAAGDGEVAAVAGRVTLLGATGAIAAGWPVKLPYDAAIECPGCTPGPGAPLAPAIGANALYVAAYAGDRPRIVTLGRDGALVAGGQHALGKTGDEIAWVRIAPTGRVWMLLTRTVDESTTSLLVPVGEDRPVGG